MLSNGKPRPEEFAIRAPVPVGMEAAGSQRDFCKTLCKILFDDVVGRNMLSSR